MNLDDREGELTLLESLRTTEGPALCERAGPVGSHRGKPTHNAILLFPRIGVYMPYHVGLEVRFKLGVDLEEEKHVQLWVQDDDDVRRLTAYMLDELLRQVAPLSLKDSQWEIGELLVSISFAAVPHSRPTAVNMLPAEAVRRAMTEANK